MRKTVALYVTVIVGMLGLMCSLFKSPTQNPNPTRTTDIVVPSLGAPYSFDSTFTVLWKNPARFGNIIRIVLLNADSTIDTLSRATINNGIYTTKLKQTDYTKFKPTRTQYRVVMSDTLNAKLNDTGNYFTLYSPYYGNIAIVSPVKNTGFLAGGYCRVQWVAPPTIGSYVSVDLYNHGQKIASLASMAANDTMGRNLIIPPLMISDSTYAVRVASYFDPSLMAEVTGITIIGTAKSDSFENDGSRDKATLLVSQVPQKHTFSFGDTDWVKFAVSPGVIYTVTSAGSAMHYASVFSKKDSLVRTVSGITLSIPYTTLSNDTLFVRLTNSYSADTASYTLLLSARPVDEVLKVSRPSLGTTLTCAVYDSIVWKSDSSVFGSYVYLYLYKGPVFISQIATSMPFAGSKSWFVPAGLETSTGYRIRVQSSLSSQVYAYSDSFTIQGVSNDQYEPDNTRPTAHAISANTLERHVLTLADTDWVKIPMAPNNLYRVATSAQVSISVSLYKSSYAGQWYYNYGYAPLFLVSSTVIDTLFVRTSQYSASAYDTVSYTISITSMDSSKIVGITRPAAGASVKAGGYETIQWAIDTALFGTSVTLALYYDTSYVDSIGKYVPNVGQYVWNVPARDTAGSKYRIKISSSLYPSVGKLSAAFSIIGIEPDAYEKDNVRAKASSIAIDEVQQRTLTLRDTDWVKVALEAGATYRIMSKASYQQEVSLYYGTSSNYFYTTNGLLSYSYTPSSSDTLYIAVLQYLSSVTYTGPYTLTVAKMDTSKANRIVFPSAGATVIAGAATTISWLSDSVTYGRYVNLYLCVDTTPLMALSTSLYNSGSFAWTPLTGLASGCRYRIKLTSYTNAALSRLSDTFCIAGLTPDAYENDNSIQRAALIPFDSAQSHTLSIGDTDWVKVITTAGNSYTITSRAGFLHYFYIYKGASPTYLYGTSGSQCTYTVTSAIGDTLYAMIRNYSSSASYTGAYTIQVKQVDLSNVGKITAPTAGASLATGASYTIRWNNDTASYGQYVSLLLCNDTSAILSITTYLSNIGQYSWSVPSGLGTDSRYRIKLVSYNNPAIYRLSDTFSITGLARDNYENDNNRSLAHFIPVDSLISRTLALGDTDWVKAPLTGGSIYSVATKAAFLHYVYTYRGSSTSYYSYGNSYANYLTIAPTVAETLSVMVRQYSASVLYTGPYTIMVRKIDPATLGSITAPAAGATVASGGALTIRWNTDSAAYGTYVNLYLCLDSSVVYTIASSLSNSGSYSFTVPSGLTTDSRYRIKLASYSTPQIARFGDAFTITGLAPDTYEPDNNPTLARQITVDSIISRTLSIGDTDWVKVPLLGGNAYTVTTSASFYHYTYLYRGSTASYYTYGSSSTNTFTITPTLPETLFVLVRQYSASATYAGPYTVIVKKIDPSKLGAVTAPAAGATVAGGAVYTIRWNPDSASYGLYVNLYLCMDSNPVYPITTYLSNSGSYSWSVPAVFSTDNRYRIKLASYTYSQYFRYSDAFTLTGLSSDPMEYDNIKTRARLIAADSIYARTLAYSDTDWVKIPVSAQTQYRIETKGSMYHYTYIYFGQSTSYVNYASYTDNILRYVPATNDTLFVQVRQYSLSTSYTGAYTLQVKKIDTAAIAGVTAPGLADTLHPGTVCTIKWTPDTVSYGSTISLALYNDTTFQSTIISGISTSGGLYTWTVPSALTAGNKYRIKLYSYSYSTVAKFGAYFRIAATHGAASNQSIKQPDEVTIAH